jgi:2',3'-cyclic-nucleotide 2'-phosphodiesterase (5'-nucleotidase family)
MKKVKFFVSIFVAAVLLTACAKKHYAIKSAEVSRIEMDGSWDIKTYSKMNELVHSFKTKLSEEMNVEIGASAQTLVKGLPQSPLTNFTADALQDYGSEFWGKVDFAVINVGGIRTILNEGTITVGNIFEVYPFDNHLVLVELQGKSVKELFDFVAKHGGEGLSKGIELVIKDQKIKSLKIGGQPLDENKIYRVTTINYVAEGNDGMTAFTQAVKYIDSDIMLRDAMIKYIKNLTTEKKLVDAKLDNRIKIEK